MADLQFTRPELTAEQARFAYDPSIVETCAPIPEHPTIIGQPRAMRALEMGLSIPGKGYNIYVSGDPGTGRSTAIRLATAPYANDLSLLRDIAFIHNFRHPDSPIAVTFAPREGKAFLLAMKEFVIHLKQDIGTKVAQGERLDGPTLKNLAQKHLAACEQRFSDPLLHTHFKHIKQDLAEHAYLFDRENSQEPPNGNFYLRYGVNLLVDHSQTTERPLIFETHPTFANLFGSLDGPCDTRDERYLPFLSIHAGSLLRAAGGFIVISAEEMLTVEGLWEAFKRFLTASALVIQNATLGSQSFAGIRPEPVSLPVKVLLVGSEDSYDAFCEHDADFLKLFKVSAEFDYTMRATNENIAGCIGFIRMVAREENLLPVENDGIAELLRYSALAAESRDELTTQLSLVADLLRESDYWARSTSTGSIDRTVVLRAIAERDYVSSVTENRIFDEIANGEMIISLDGNKTGVVNGLAVLDRGPSSFGTPTVISATVAPGNEGIVNIEHEAGLSGEIHDKGLLILEGYLRKRYARNFPLSIYSGICFEQSYAEIDGDSASSSELYALLSAIGEIPVKQNIAVTGSVNQMGELQPVGGINEKITGFYNVCKRLGLKNHPGVIIPVQNIKSLILPYEIIEAIERKEFHIYPVQTIDEGMQVLTDRPAGTRNQKGNFPPDTLNRTIEERLKDLYEISRPQN
ncbi:MAG: AAA family ATPase [Sphaerochaetaceae bacterium]|jgi:lon-related putative ATP-dependent protease|nr:AAA family ATPase [Sphaerochaetaceae bacterium]MDD3940925.1 AAA family ATPase [Sphaerochaetaceae bacterium]MDX9939376.1 AAA family ATPase [Sphaerochaetaceae bacterium]